MSGILDGKIAIVTGGGSGIGEATAKIMAREGAAVAVVDVDSGNGERVAGEIRQHRGDALFIEADVSREDAVAGMVAKVVGRWGRLDCAFNNAGFGNVPLPTAELQKPDWDKVLNVVLDGVFLCMKYEINAMLNTGGGAIVNTSSNAGRRAVPTQSAYSAAKAGVIGLTRTTAVEYALQGIRVNAICPGLIMTPIIQRLKEEGRDWGDTSNIPMGRAGLPAEIGEAAAWLCSSKASYLTGQAISIDGGSTAV